MVRRRFGVQLLVGLTRTSYHIDLCGITSSLPIFVPHGERSSCTTVGEPNYAARAAKRDLRVGAKGASLSQATTRGRLRAAAIARF